MRDDEFEGMKERLQFIGQEQFHRTIICPRSRRRVSFAIAGDASDQSTPALLCCTPSFCSRYVGGPGVHKFAQKYGVRVISLDRPGQGGQLLTGRNRYCISDSGLRYSVMRDARPNPNIYGYGPRSRPWLCLLMVMQTMPSVF